MSTTNPAPNEPRNWEGVVQDDPNDPRYIRMLKADRDAWAAAQSEKARSLTISSFPSTPRYLQREMGGAVRRGAHRKAFSLETLRYMREHSILYAPIHNALQHKIRHICTPWSGDQTEVGIKVVHKDWRNRDVDVPDGFDKYIRQFEDVLWTPSLDYEGSETLADVMALLLEDLLTINRPAIEIMHGIMDPDRLLQWRAIDGALVWPMLTYVEHWWAQNNTLFGYDRGQLRPEDKVELLSKRLNVDLAGMDYALVREGTAEQWYPKGKLIVGPWQNRTDVTFVGYPPSALEEAVVFAAAFTDAFEFTSGHLSKGIFLDYILGLPAALHDEDVDAFLNMLQEIGQGVKNKGRIAAIALPPGAENALQRIPLQAEFNEMGFQSMVSLCASMTCSGIYRVHPSVIGIRPWDGGAGPRLSEPSQGPEIESAQVEGLRSYIGHLVARFLEPLAKRCHPDLRLYVHYGDIDAEKQAIIIQTGVNTVMTVNEGRLLKDLPPLGFWLPPKKLEEAQDDERNEYSDNPYNHPLPICQMLIQAKVQKDQQDRMQQQQMQQMQAQQAMGGDFTRYDEEPAPDQDQPMNKAAPQTITLHIHGGGY